MKNKNLSHLVVTIILVIYSLSMFAEDPSPPPPPGGGHGLQGHQAPTDAPIDDGVAVFLVFASLIIGIEILSRPKERGRHCSETHIHKLNHSDDAQCRKTVEPEFYRSDKVRSFLKNWKYAFQFFR